MRQMLSVGGFVFAWDDGTPYSGLTRTTDGGWVTIPRFGAKPLSMNTGQALEDISVNGTWFGAEGMASMDALRELQGKREPQVVTDGYGRNLGLWTIKRLQEKQDRIIDDGTAMALDFTITLEEYAGDNRAQS